MASCLLCGRGGKLVKAHAIPEAFFRLGRVDGETPLLISSTPDARPKRTPIGIYDPSILCDECEPRFGVLDDYGISVLLNDFDHFFVPILRAGKTVAFRSEEVNQETLLRFLISVLWRASVSSHSFYAGVRLGPLETLAGHVLDGPDPEFYQTFSATLSRWSATEEREALLSGLMSPFVERFNGIRTYRLYFGQTIAYVKADKRAFQSPFKELALMARPDLIVITRNFDASADFAAMVGVAKASTWG